VFLLKRLYQAFGIFQFSGADKKVQRIGGFQKVLSPSYISFLVVARFVQVYFSVGIASALISHVVV